METGSGHTIIKTTMALSICCVFVLFALNAENASAFEVQEQIQATADSSPPLPVYVALGDSFSAGLGAGDYDRSSGNCFRSANAYSIDDEFGVAGNYNLSPFFYACTGATTQSVLKKQVGKHISAIKKARLLSITVGGNNIDFSGILAFCLLHYDCANSPIDKKGSLLGDSLPLKIAAQKNKLQAVFVKLRKAAPFARIYVLGYPHLFSSFPDDSCIMNRYMDLSEQEFLNNTADRLNDVIREAAEAAGVNFLPVAGKFSGHELCTDEPWINDMDFFNRAAIESFHPNAYGQKAYSEVLQEAIGDASF